VRLKPEPVHPSLLALQRTASRRRPSDSYGFFVCSPWAARGKRERWSRSTASLGTPRSGNAPQMIGQRQTYGGSGCVDLRRGFSEKPGSAFGPVGDQTPRGGERIDLARGPRLSTLALLARRGGKFKRSENRDAPRRVVQTGEPRRRATASRSIAPAPAAGSRAACNPLHRLAELVGDLAYRVPGAQWQADRRHRPGRFVAEAGPIH
jgi:hypothetical protein